MSLVEILEGIRATNVTKTVHNSTYDAISVTRPELSQAGRTVLVTGGGTGAGLAIAKAFIGAPAATVIVVGRRADVLEKARAELEDGAKALGKSPRIIARPCDIAKDSDADALWQFFADEKIIVDVYVANAAAFQEPQPLLEMGTKTVWSFFETSVRSPMYFSEKFCKQPGDGKKFIVNVTTANIHSTGHPVAATYPAYTWSKFAGTLFFQLLAQDIPAEKVQVLNFHPGVIFNSYWATFGVDKKHFDDDQMTGAFAVWAASKEAAFLHGRTVWASWDVEELATGDLRKRLDEDFYFLRGGIGGLHGTQLA